MVLKLKFITILLFIGCIFSCKNIETKTPSNKDDKSIKLFKPLNTQETGLIFKNQLAYQEELNIIDYLYYYNGGGVAIGDINNDGLDDIYLTANQGTDRLFLNLGNLKFKDITASSNIEMSNTWSSGVTMEDLNNDGLLDIHVAKVGVFKNLETHNLVYINQGNLSFREQSTELGLAFKGYSTQATFLDYDQDGDLDMYLLNHSVHTPRSYGSTDKRKVTDSIFGDRFYENKLNEGQFKFEEVTRKAGIYSSALGYGLGIVATDVNNDGHMDLYIANDFHENDYLYINQGNKAFKESAELYLPHTSRFSMGVDAADLNNDALVDIFTLDMMPYTKDVLLKSGGEDTDKVTEIKKNFGFRPQYARNNFQLNTGNNSFTDIALITETYATDWSWSTLIQDFDNDGLNDIFITNGIFKRPNDLDYIKYLSTVNFANYTKSKQTEIEKKLIEEMPTLKIPNVLFKNEGNLSFKKLSSEVGLSDSYSNGAAYSDLDNDGDLDLVINNINENVTLLENTSNDSTTNNFIQFSFVTDSVNKNSTGIKVKLHSNGKIFVREQSPTRGFQSSSSRKLHFGLGSINHIDSVEIIWPDKTIQTTKNSALNSLNTIIKNINRKHSNKKELAHDYIYSKFPYQHLENNYQDYSREPLIPEKLSNEGPAVVYADFDGDGTKDLYLGGARFQEPYFYIQSKQNTFSPKTVSDFVKDKSYEDISAAAFDLENDGDLDLYVVSGGNDLKEGDPNLQDRIYINDGKGNFERLQAQLPTSNGGVIAVGDYDSDGFDDLFIGARSIPGAYGNTPVSLILKNTGKGNFQVTAQDKLGMITDAKWIDINNDTFLDLVIVGDWMPITVLLNNKEGKFTNETQKLGLGSTSGMWNCIAFADIDRNGKIDIIAGNAGENFKWKASVEKPIKLYIDDFDKNGQPDPIIFYNFFGDQIPFASKDKLTGQLPYLKKKFLSYKSFSKVSSIEELTGKSAQDIKMIKEVKELRSMLFLNQGDDFKGSALPRESQFSSIQDFTIVETGKATKIYFVGNSFNYVTELGASDGNAGGVLTANKSGDFEKTVPLQLPNNQEYRKIIPLENHMFLVLSNDNKALIIQSKFN